MDRYVATIGCLACFLAVAVGAFATHGLKGQISAASIEWIKTGAMYQFFHGLALVLVQTCPSISIRRWATILFTLGIVLFSGSLYTMAMTQVRALGAITPFGGASFLTGWICLSVGYWPRSVTKST